jgi:glycosyltransferase involved in cell wall biosynthesis
MNRKNIRIVILSGNHICNNPRVLKEAEAFSLKGYDIEVLGLGTNAELSARDTELVNDKKWKYTPLLRNQTFWKKINMSGRRKTGNLVSRLFRIANQWQLGCIAGALLAEGEKRQAYLYIAHSEPGMWAAEELRKRGNRVGVDMEDWYSEDLLPQARKDRPILLLKKLERNLLRHGFYSSCTSEAMADALVKEYECKRPVVIRNVFPIKDREGLDGKWKDRPLMGKWLAKNDPTLKRPKETPLSIHWFSQTVGPGRGLETLFQALGLIKGSWELHLRGNLKGYEDWLEGVCPESVRKKLTVHGLVKNEELLSRIAEHDIGYCGEPKTPSNKNLTISNKLFHYLQAGLAVLASDTAGQIEGASQSNGAVWNFKEGQRDDLGKKLARLLANRSLLEKMRRSAWKAGNRHSWEKEKEKLPKLKFPKRIKKCTRG